MEMCFAGEQILAYGGVGMGGSPPDIRLLSLDGKDQELQLDVSAYCAVIKEQSVLCGART